MINHANDRYQRPFVMTDWPARVRFGSFYAIGQMGYIFMTLAAVITAGSVAAAGIRGALTLFVPIATLLAALPIVFIPHAARTGTSVARPSRARPGSAVNTPGGIAGQ
jgi:hypothetical protein